METFVFQESKSWRNRGICDSKYFKMFLSALWKIFLLVIKRCLLKRTVQSLTTYTTPKLSSVEIYLNWTSNNAPIFAVHACALCYSKALVAAKGGMCTAQYPSTYFVFSMSHSFCRCHDCTESGYCTQKACYCGKKSTLRSETYLKRSLYESIPGPWAQRWRA